MKKLMLMLLIACAAISCKKECDCDENTANIDTIPNQGTESAARDAMQLNAADATCTDTVVVYKNQVDLDWTLANYGYFCGVDAPANKIYVGLGNIPENSTKTQRAEWLRDNRSKIDFTSSEEFIETAHRVPVTRLGMNQIPGSAPIIRLSEIRDAVNNLSPSNQNRFNNDKYTNYVAFSINAQGTVDVDVLNSYDPGKYSYSIPFVRSLIRKYGENAELRFAEHTDSHGNSILYFGTGSNNNMYYYDYSHKPTLTKDGLLDFTDLYKSPQ